MNRRYVPRILAPVSVGSSNAVLDALDSGDRGAMIGALVDLESGRRGLQISVVERLIDLLTDSDKEIRRRAAGALVTAARSKRYCPVLRDALDDTDPDRRWGACFALNLAGESSSRIFQVAVDSLAHQDRDVCWAATHVVVQACRNDSARSGVLLGLVSSGKPEVRKMALYCLRELGSASMSLFAGALTDEHTAVRLAALAGLFRLSRQSMSSPVDADVIARVRDCLENDSNEGVRRASAAVLGRIMGDDDEACRASFHHEFLGGRAMSESTERLVDRSCVPCRGGVPPLGEEAIAPLLAQLKGWTVQNNHHLIKQYSFIDFASALAFVNRVGELAEREGHHPDICLAWGRVGLKIWTHKIDGLSDSDFVFAAKADAVL